MMVEIFMRKVSGVVESIIQLSIILMLVIY